MAARGLLLAAVLAVAVPAALCQSPAAAKAPGPAKAPALNVTAILEKNGQYATLIRLMKATQQDTQLNSQLKGGDSSTGFTVFAPTDNAFAGLKSGTLNSLSQQEQVALVQAHIVPQFYSMDSFETASNPVRTQASGEGGPYTLNITATGAGQVNVSTGIVATSVGTALRADQPLAVYSVDKVLLPYGLFGPKPPASSPPAPTAGKKSPKGSAGSVAQAPSGASDSKPTGAATAVGARWSFAALAATAAAVFVL